MAVALENTHGNLVMRVTDEQIDLVKELDTSKEIWGTLKECPESSN